MQKRILVVDDDDMNLMRTKRILGRNYDVFLTGSGSEALDTLKREKIDLVLLDIEMPKMDGHRLTKLVKDDSRLKLLPVVIFSSLIDDQMRIKGEQLGADEQLTKPEIGNLVKIIDQLVAERHLDM